MNMRIYYVLPLCLLFACDKTERDWSKCSDAAACAQGYTCSPDYRCVLAVDAAAEVAAPAADAGGLEVVGLDTVDAPLEVTPEVAVDLVADVAVDMGVAVDVAPDVAVDVIVDVAVALDVAVDLAVADAVADLSVDRRPVDSQGSCSSDNDCPDSGPLCLAFRCAKCKTSNDCLSRADSGAGGGVCEPTSGRCVACAKSSDCTADPTKPVCVANQCVACISATNECRAKSSAAPVCDSATGKCVGCLANADCTSSADGGVDGGTDGGADGGVAAGFCNLTTNQCVGCLAHSNCNDPSRPICGSSQTCVGCGTQSAPLDGCATKNPALPVCKLETGACVECVGDLDCQTSTSPACDTSANKCVECVQSSHCKAASAPVCDTAARHCVQCLKDGDCSGATPICTNQQCTKCTSDAQCATKLGANPGVCMFHQDGRCATDAETIYVQDNATICSPSAASGGTAVNPFCNSQDGANAVASTKRLVVMRGPDAWLGWSATYSGAQVSVVGQNGATIAPGAAVGIHLVSGDLYLRGLTVAGSFNTGITVDSGATLRMDRSILTNNAKGGLIVAAGGAFDISNSVFDKNGPGSVGAVSFGGVYLGAVSAAGPGRFWYNTVINSGAAGVVCADPSQSLSGLLFYNNTVGDMLNCATPTSSKSGDPLFDTSRPYHLTAASPCVNAGGTTCPLDDIDGDTRPIGTACDCGADEYKP